MSDPRESRRFAVFWMTHKEPTKAADLIMELEAKVEAKAERLEVFRELVQRTVGHADSLLLDLPPEMVREFRAALEQDHD